MILTVPELFRDVAICSNCNLLLHIIYSSKHFTYTNWKNPASTYERLGRLVNIPDFLMRKLRLSLCPCIMEMLIQVPIHISLIPVQACTYPCFHPTWLHKRIYAEHFVGAKSFYKCVWGTPQDKHLCAQLFTATLHCLQHPDAASKIDIFKSGIVFMMVHFHSGVGKGGQVLTFKLALQYKELNRASCVTESFLLKKKKFSYT